jgi:hypothetical protein
MCSRKAFCLHLYNIQVVDVAVACLTSLCGHQLWLWCPSNSVKPSHFQKGDANRKRFAQKSLEERGWIWQLRGYVLASWTSRRGGFWTSRCRGWACGGLRRHHFSPAVSFPQLLFPALLTHYLPADLLKTTQFCPFLQDGVLVSVSRILLLSASDTSVGTGRNLPSRL